MTPRTQGILIGAAAVLAALALPAWIAPEAPGKLTLGGFRVQKSVELPGTPAEIFDAFTGDVSAWWDHHQSDSPKLLVIEPHAGGTFHEVFDDAGNGCIHADVIYSERGKLLRLHGPLGLSGWAIDMVHTFTFEEAGEGRTKLSLDLRVAGEVQEELETVVSTVWDHFLVEQFQRWVEAGGHHEPR